MKKIYKTLLSLLLVFVFVLGISQTVKAKESAIFGVTINETGGYAVTVNRHYDMAFEMLNEVNSQRAKAGLGSLSMDQGLLDAAMNRTAEISILFDHTRPNSQDCYTILDGVHGENIAYGYKSVAVVMNGWMESADHRENILKPDFNSIGIGVAERNGVLYWVQSYSRDNMSVAANRQANDRHTYYIDVDADYCKSRGVDLGSITYKPRSIDDEGQVYAKGTMFRLYNPETKEHFYTADKTERNGVFKAGWDYEGVAWIAPETSSTPVYRLYNPVTGDHHYTTDAHERDQLANKHGWIYEKIGWYSDDEKRAPLYRLFHPGLLIGAHHYTRDLSEKEHLEANGWIYEGIGWYGIE